MARKDFNVEEPDYYVSGDALDENKEIVKENENKSEKIPLEKPSDIYHQDYGDNSDMSSIGTSRDANYIDNSSVVFEENEHMTPEEKVKDFLGNINKRVIFVICGILFLILVIIIVIYAYIAKDRASYFSTIIVPDVVYMGETGSVSVVANGKKNLDETKTVFTTSNKDAVTFLNDELTGKDVVNTIIPAQEGRVTISINSKLGKKSMANMKKEIVVCPAFNSDLLYIENISIVKGSFYDLSVDYGEEECSKGITYESSNESIMTVDKTGKITGVNTGRAILTIRKGARFISVNVDITKQSIPMKSFEVIPTKVQLRPKQNIRAKIKYSPANATTSKIYFDTASNLVAKVSDGGLITAVAAGETSITVRPVMSSLGQKISVVVSKEVSSTDAVVTEVSLSKSEFSLVQGESEKILAILTPDNARDKKINWSSSDDSIASVTSSGVVLGKKPGSAYITASSSNNISRSVKVNVSAMKIPVITSSDGIATNQWHNKPYSLSFSGSESGVIYYYGTSNKNMNNKGSKVTISKDESATYYVKACRNNVCSGTSSYISKIDITKPVVLTATSSSSIARSTSVQIAMRDNTSLVKRWCVTPVDSYNTCKWKSIKTSSNPVVTYVATYNSTYYAFAEDAAGNISNSYSFEVTNIE